MDCAPPPHPSLPPVKRQKTETNAFISFGETMIRFQPIDKEPVSSVSRFMPQSFLRSLGGDELNVSVALALLGTKTRWVSVLPKGPMGDIVTDNCEHYGIEFAGTRVEGDIGTFTVLPEAKTVHYQRRHSAFALHDPKALMWPGLLNGDLGKPWLHATGITPLISMAARQSWDAHLTHACSEGIPISLDLNHRKQLGTLSELWAMVDVHVANLELIILSIDQLVGLAALLSLTVSIGFDSGDAACLTAMAALHRLWRCKRVALCRKVRDASGKQRRWSLLSAAKTDASGTTHFLDLSTSDTPVLRPHAPAPGSHHAPVPISSQTHLAPP
jgi:2-dehydro-3-deoxygluconokinase